MASSSSESSLFNIEKLDGTNFPFWKEQIYNVLVQKKQVKPIKLMGVKPEAMGREDWEDLDELARSTIMLTLSKSVYFNVKDTKTSHELWEKLCDLYEQKSAASQVYWLKQLVDLKMKEGTAMSNHLNEFNTIFSNLSAQEIEFSDSVKALFLLITLPESWDTFRTAISNSAPPGGLTEANVSSSLLTEEVNRKNLDNSHGDNALVVRGRSNDKGKSQDRGRSKSKSSRRNVKDMECYNCGKKGHLKKDCRSAKKDKHDKGKGKKQEDDNKGKSSVKIEEINAVSGDEDGDILLNSGLEQSQLVTTVDQSVQDWVMDSWASFHVTPHREWFTNYDAKRTGLGNDYACEIMGVGDVKLKFQHGSTFILKNVRHVPKLTKSLISS